ncbi:hypothetical protein WJX72_002983 [[Myrmecia] bisecta]|uniref:Transcription initiation factor TFIID subunit 8 n=1 Tax=[Myrmecia] bisecta TaxID=41462 RepID=A0AAW1QPU6_9CHLO
MAEQYSRAVARVAAGQIAQLSGFDAVQRSATEALAELLLQHIAEVGASSHAYAEMAGRTHCNVNDLLLAFADLGISISDLMKYASLAEEDMAFAHEPVQKYPVVKRPTAVPTFVDKNEEPPSHIPRFLPAFPDSHTYASTPVFATHDKDARQQLLAASKAKRQAEKAAVKLHARSQAALPARAPALAPPALASQPGKPEAALSPFLAAPLWEHAESPGMAAVAAAGAADVPPSTSALTSFQPAVEGHVGLEADGWKELPSNVAPSTTAPAAGFALDWVENVRRQALASIAHLGFEDAYADKEEEVSQGEAAARKRIATIPRDHSSAAGTM